jgi:hypothetical protein
MSDAIENFLNMLREIAPNYNWSIHQSEGIYNGVYKGIRGTIKDKYNDLTHCPIEALLYGNDREYYWDTGSINLGDKDKWAIMGAADFEDPIHAELRSKILQAVGLE